jgi:hypothetical protein
MEFMEFYEDQWNVFMEIQEKLGSTRKITERQGAVEHGIN